MAYIIDGALVLILLLSIWWSYRKGFVQSMVQLVGWIAAIVVSFTLSAAVSPVLFDSFAAEPLKQSVANTLQHDASSTVEEQVDNILDALPSSLANVLHADELSDKLVADLNSTLEQSAQSVAESVVTNVVRPIAVSLVQFLLFIVLFILCMIAVALLKRVIKPITKLPLIHQADGLLGGVVGIVKGALIVWIAVEILQLFAVSNVLITVDQLRETTLANWVSNLYSFGNLM